MIVTIGGLTQSRRAAAIVAAARKPRGYRELLTALFVCKCGSIG